MFKKKLQKVICNLQKLLQKSYMQREKTLQKVIRNAKKALQKVIRNDKKHSKGNTQLENTLQNLFLNAKKLRRILHFMATLRFAAYSKAFHNVCNFCCSVVPRMKLIVVRWLYPRRGDRGLPKRVLTEEKLQNLLR